MKRFRLISHLFVLAALAMPSALQAAEVRVAAEPGALLRAIENAQAGDRLRLEPGQHEGPVVITVPLVLDGGDAATLSGSGTGSVVTIEAPDVTVKGLTITGSGLSAETLDAGVKLLKPARNAVVSGNRILDNLVGVDVHGAKDAKVLDNLIEGRRDLRMNERGNGIYVWNSPGLLAEGNTIRYGRDGIFVNNSHQDVFRRNTFEKLRFAVHYMHGNSGVIEDNVSIGNDIGYALMFSKRLRVANNVSINDADHGLMLNFANQAEVAGNYVRGGGEKCLFIYNASKNSITGNRFEACEIGVHFTAGSERNDFAGNAFIANRTQVKYVGTRHLDWSTGGRGNYWSDHSAFDTNGDGVAEAAYRPNDMMDQILWTQPAAKLLTGSPAVQLLSFTQSRFPALLPGGVVDTAPLMHAPALDLPEAAAQFLGEKG
ncbi:nitrous oxide reductase family maturation protein NosD [Rhizobiales bacterium]|uniref:nitrous oxide reductase family maturation protein NosD n=1 Tax=Hongsoonwoonella zoysiae TaxID=2821844 RepID=UPI0015613257|nr:nitrous oxide reductase family maturation protein NosD [Hongsoonwoonella zoysiae]NRG18196.1 nitrous oxide reductase family maturation protein NosD [Hongsoonwoonella zoysiae]